MVGIGGERVLVPVFGVVVAAELAAGVADERGDVGMFVMADRVQRRDAAFVIAAVIDQGVGGMVAGEEILGGGGLVSCRGLRFPVRLLVGG